VSTSIVGISKVHGSRFGAEVARADEVTAARAPEPRAIPDLLLQVLTGLNPETEERRKELSQLLGERFSSNKRMQSFIDAELTQARAKLIEQHESLKTECVAAQQRSEALKRQIIELQQEAVRKDQVVTRAKSALTNAEQARKALSRFASADAIKKADTAIQTAEAKCEEASNAAAPIREQINRLTFVEIPRLDEKFRELSAQELRVRSLVTGEGFTDEEFGIQVRGRA
jgi:hypothetical protein